MDKRTKRHHFLSLVHTAPSGYRLITFNKSKGKEGGTVAPPPAGIQGILSDQFAGKINPLITWPHYRQHIKIKTWHEFIIITLFFLHLYKYLSLKIERKFPFILQM